MKGPKAEQHLVFVSVIIAVSQELRGMRRVRGWLDEEQNMREMTAFKIDTHWRLSAVNINKSVGCHTGLFHRVHDHAHQGAAVAESVLTLDCI